MKRWTTLALIIGGLCFVAYFNLVPRQVREAPSAAPEPEEQHAALQEKPPPQPQPQARAGQPPSTFGEYPCRRDCSEDKAGYRWAQDESITDPDDCTGKTGAFIEGCRVFAEQQARRR